MVALCDVEETVKISLSNIIEWCSDGGFEMFLDKLSEKAGHPDLMEITYDVVGFESNDVLIMKVKGCVEVKEGSDVEEDHSAGTPSAQ